MSPETSYPQPAESGAYSGNRDIALRALLGIDYEYANQSGLLNMFYYNPDTGEDGLMHTLGGEYFISEDGTRRVDGFHHEPSADAAWIYNADGERVGQPKTYVDRAHLEQKKSRQRKEFAELPYEPYRARVWIDNQEKKVEKVDPGTGELTVVPINNNMFPKEYDALAVMQAIRIANDARDKELDKVDHENRIIIGEGRAPMLDGKNTMTLRIILDEDTGKVVSAYPLVRLKTMELGRDEIKQHLGLKG